LENDPFAPPARDVDKQVPMWLVLAGALALLSVLALVWRRGGGRQPARPSSVQARR
jgi:hypothetical protein